jgi:hypothetical protein
MLKVLVLGDMSDIGLIGEYHAEGAALPFAALDLDLSAVLGHDVRADR